MSHRRQTAIIGNSMTALCGGALALNLLLVAGLMVLLGIHGLGYFWQQELVLFERADAKTLLGEVWEEIPAGLDAEGKPRSAQLRMKVGNRDVTGQDFVWIERENVVREARPERAVLLERREWGNFYGFMSELRRGDEVLASGGDDVWEAFGPLHDRKLQELEELEELEEGPIGDINYRLEQLRLELRRLDMEEARGESVAAARERVHAEMEQLEGRYQELATELAQAREEFLEETLVMETAAGETAEVAVGDVVRAIRPNDQSVLAGMALYVSRIWEFLSAEPRESNTEGGIFPAIFGTVLMVFLMTFAVTPLGVLAAVYLREYAKNGLAVRAVRIAVNNLAGVPSIVFGVFGLGFFVYLIGGTIDQLFYPEALPSPTYGTGGILWASLTLALLTVPVVIVAAEEGLAAVPSIVREGSLALGATKFETIWKVVVPAAAPGILTGMILAMARAAGEVAPLMIVGMVKLAPDLPVDGHFPYVHLDRKFMHLGFHIYDVGFQSPNVEATKPLVFATALLLVVVVVLMNLLAIWIRNHLKQKYAGSAV
jgi:phosphate transport system permease protein